MDFSEATDKPLPREIAAQRITRPITGRPSKLTPKVAQTIHNAIQGGSFLTVAAGLAGVAVDSVHEWIVRGRADFDAGLKTRYALFAQGLARAQHRAEANAVATIQAGGDGKYKDWRAQAWWLERRHRDRWAEEKPGNKVEITLTLTGSSAAVLEELLRAANAKTIETTSASVIDKDTSE